MIYIYLSTLLSIFLVIYHFLLYPILVKFIAKNRAMISPVHSNKAHMIYFIIPMYNEATQIEEKIKNIKNIDYPKDKLKVIFVNDGSTDNTLTLLNTSINADDILKDSLILEIKSNHGKVNALNLAVEKIQSYDQTILFFSDVSAMLSKNTLKRVSSFFNNKCIGAYTTSYSLNKSATPGEIKYWNYQKEIRYAESCLGSPIGYHGSGYAIRRSLWNPLGKNTINDDFIIPMTAVFQGFKGVYDTKSFSYENEVSSNVLDWSRRIRISEGNVQQFFILAPYLSMKNIGLFFMFISSKALRTVIPFLLLFILFNVVFFTLSKSILISTSVIVSIFIFIIINYICKTKISSILGYIYYGYLAIIYGWINFFSNRGITKWRRAKEFKLKSSIPGSVRICKWIMDKIIALIGMVILLAMLPFIAILIKLTSPGPIFFKQIRVGKSNDESTKLFNLYKFRSMKVDAEKDGAQLAKKNDPRATKFGLFLRKSRIDEFPQFFNVLKGDMSIVGPRPERPEFYQKLETEITYFTERNYEVLPGITGFAQVNLNYDETIDDVRAKVGYDHAYAACLTKLSIWFITDCKIILKTFAVIFKKIGQ